MAEAAATASNREASQTQEEIPPTEEGAETVSVLDPTFLAFALPFALIIDVLDFFFEFGIVVSLIVGAPLILWMVWKAGKSSVGTQEIKQRQASRQAARAAARRALRRGILIFIAELIPLLNLIPFWTVAILLTLRVRERAPTRPQVGEVARRK